jgi:hypothetical protein
VGSDRWWLNRLAPLRYLDRTYTRRRESAKVSLRSLPPTATPLAVRSDAPEAIRNGLPGYAQLSRHGRLACLFDQFSPLSARCLELGFQPGHPALE